MADCGRGVVWLRHLIISVGLELERNMKRRRRRSCAAQTMAKRVFGFLDLKVETAVAWGAESCALDPN